MTQDKVRAITNAPAPKNKQELQSFIGMITYYDKFLPQLSTMMDPLHKLLRKNAKFVWGKAQDKAFKEVKEKLQSAPADSDRL